MPLPPLPPGFSLDQSGADLPPLPAGFRLDQPNQSNQTKEDPSFLQNMARGVQKNWTAGPMGVMMGAMLGPDLLGDKKLDEYAYKAGDKTSSMATAMGASPEVAGLTGAATNVGVQAIPAYVGGKVASSLASPAMDSMGKWLMQSALKPTIADLKTGKAATAIQTLLDEGINPTKGGVEILQGKISALNDEIASKIANSTATVDKNKVASALHETLDKFSKQVNPNADMATIRQSWEEFLNHPYFQKVEAEGTPLLEALNTATKGKQQALQAAGKLKTFAQQQESLANGGRIGLSPSQPSNELFFNSGVTGGNAVSPGAFPVEGMPRFPGRYTNNIDRVPEGQAGFQDAMAAYAQRKADETVARSAVDQWQSTKDSMPVQLAQELKKNTYGILAKKYGQVGTADTEAQKALARGLKEQIAAAVPGVGELNAQEGKLIEALNVTERRALMDANKNPMGLSLLAQNPATWAAFIADKSALFKSLMARMLYSGQERIPEAIGGIGTAGFEAGRILMQGRHPWQDQ